MPEDRSTADLSEIDFQEARVGKCSCLWEEVLHDWHPPWPICLDPPVCLLGKDSSTLGLMGFSSISYSWVTRFVKSLIFELKLIWNKGCNDNLLMSVKSNSKQESSDYCSLRLYFRVEIYPLIMMSCVCWEWKRARWGEDVSWSERKT